MADSPEPALPRLTAEQRRVATAQFERAKQVMQSKDYTYGAQLLMDCCKIDPGNGVFRQALRFAQRNMYGNEGKGQALAGLRSTFTKLKLQNAERKGNWIEVLRLGELMMMRDPWSVWTNRRVAQALDELGQLDLAIWNLTLIQSDNAKDWQLNRQLARLYEKRGSFKEAIALWQMVARARPKDEEAQHKAKELVATATIAKGRYEEAAAGKAPTPIVRDKDRQAETDVHDAAPGTDVDVPAAGDDRMPREVATLRAKIKAAPTNPNTYLHLVSYHRRQDQFDEARKVLKEGLAATGDNFELSQQLLDLEIEPLRRDLAIAEEQLKKGKKPELVQLHAKLAKEVNTRELEFHRRRSDRFPTDVGARFQMAIRLLRAGKPDEAIRELQEVRKDQRHQGKALYYLALCFRARKNWKLAQRNFEEALHQMSAEEDALRKEAMYHLAVGLAENGDVNRAVEIGSELANLDFSYKNISALLDEWQTRNGR